MHPLINRLSRRYLVIIIVLLTAFPGILTGCKLIKSTIRFREDIRSATYMVPAVSGLECRKKLQNVLISMVGIEEVLPDTTKMTITIRYNSRELAQKNILYAISQAGIDVDDILANPRAKAVLPEECR